MVTLEMMNLFARFKVSVIIFGSCLSVPKAGSETDNFEFCTLSDGGPI